MSAITIAGPELSFVLEMTDSFSASYRQARTKFFEAASSSGARIERFVHPLQGPDEQELSTDVAWFGRRNATKVLVALSGTHGVEGFFGSAAQIEWLRRAGPQKLPPGVSALLVHAVNPYGFAWQRRVNEDNVDVNRNWVDFDAPPPPNEGYAELADSLCPRDWTPEAQTKSNAQIADWTRRNGPRAFQQAVTGGQYEYPNGIFYGGTRPVWSRITLTQIFEKYLGSAKELKVLDFHTGLGDHGFAEPIVHRRHDSSDFARIRAWVGANAKSIFGGESVSSDVVGDGLSALPRLLPHAVVDAVSIECGVRPIEEVGLALRADAWLYAYGKPLLPESAAIRAQIRAAFHDDGPIWQGMALGQALFMLRAATASLTDRQSL